MNITRAVVIGICGLVVGAPVSSVFAARMDSIVTIKNRSSWDIHELYLSSTDDDEWGPDQLGSQVIDSGGKFVLHSIPCDAYDVRLVDEDGDACVVEAVALCADQGDWVISDRDLLACQAGTDE